MKEIQNCTETKSSNDCYLYCHTNIDRICLLDFVMFICCQKSYPELL